jgi:hypothetical protein
VIPFFLYVLVVLEVAALIVYKIKLVRIVGQIFNGDLAGFVWSGIIDNNDPPCRRIVAAIISDEIDLVREPRSLSGGHSKLGAPKIMRTHRCLFIRCTH